MAKKEVYFLSLVFAIDLCYSCQKHELIINKRVSERFIKKFHFFRYNIKKQSGRDIHPYAGLLLYHILLTYFEELESGY